MRRAGIDVGGTKCLAVVLDDDDRVVDERRRPTPHGAASIIETLVALVDDLGDIDALGIGMPGLVTRGGVVRAAPNLVDVADLAVAAILAERLGIEVLADNDATCATVAEWELGAGRGSTDMVMVTLGTGIGGGVVAGGQLVRGANGFAGEIGHMVVDPAGPLCPCGRRGCWERYSSGSGLAWLAGGRRGEDVVADARAGDVAARGVIAEFGRYTGLGLANLTNLLDPERFVIAGGLVSSADVVLPAIRAGLREALYSPESRPHPEVLMAELGESAGAIGAALLALGFD